MACLMFYFFPAGDCACVFGIIIVRVPCVLVVRLTTSWSGEMAGVTSSHQPVMVGPMDSFTPHSDTEERE